MRQSTRVILNSIFNIAQQLVNIALQLFLLAFVLRRLDNEAYSIFLLAGSMAAVINGLRDAVSTGCVTYVARYHEQHGQEMINRVISTASSFLLVPAAVVMIASLFAGPWLSGFFHIRSDLRPAMNQVAVLTGVSVLFVLPLFPHRSTLEALQRYDLIAYANAAFRLVRAAVIVVAFLVLKADILYVMLATVVGDVGAQWTMYFWARRLMPGLRSRPWLVDWQVLRGLLTFGFWLVLTSLTSIGMTEGTKWIVGKMLSVEYITFLTVAMYFVALLTMAVQTMTLVLVPVASRYKSMKADAVLAEMLVRGTRYSGVVSLGVMAVLLPVTTPLIRLWLRPDLDWIGPYAAVVGLVGALYLSHSCCRAVLVGTGDSKRPFLAVCAGGVVTILAVALTTGVLGWGFGGGILGICLGWATIWVVMTYYALRSIPVSRIRLARQGYLEPILAAAPAAALGWLVQRFLPADNWPGLIGVCGLSCLTFVLCFLPWLTGQEWHLVGAGLRRAGGVLSRRGN